jgi:hypothetical protein
VSYKWRRRVAGTCYLVRSVLTPSPSLTPPVIPTSVTAWLPAFSVPQAYLQTPPTHLRSCLRICIVSSILRQSIYCRRRAARGPSPPRLASRRLSSPRLASPTALVDSPAGAKQLHRRAPRASLVAESEASIAYTSIVHTATSATFHTHTATLCGAPSRQAQAQVLQLPLPEAASTRALFVHERLPSPMRG